MEREGRGGRIMEKGDKRWVRWEEEGEHMERAGDER